MKIAILSDDFPPRSKGGAGVVAGHLARGLVRRGHEISVITTTLQPAHAGRATHDGVLVHSIFTSFHDRWRHFRGLYNPQTVGPVAEILAAFRPDIVHCHNVHAALSFRNLATARRCSSKVFLTAHDVMLFHYGKFVEFIAGVGTDQPESFDYHVSSWQQLKRFRLAYLPFRRAIIRSALQHVDRVFAVSHALEQVLAANGIQHITVIHNGTPLHRWAVSPKAVHAFRSRWGLERKFVLLWGGRLSRAKGGTELLRTLALVVRMISNAVVLVLSDRHGYGQELIAEASAIGLADRFLFTGWLQDGDLTAAYHSCDVVVVPSACFDSFPTMNIEAMACRKPVVGTCFGGTPEIVQDGETGYVVNPFNTEQFAQRIIELARDPERCERFGQAGYERIRQHFTIDHHVDATLAWYEGHVHP